MEGIGFEMGLFQKLFLCVFYIFLYLFLDKEDCFEAIRGCRIFFWMEDLMSFQKIAHKYFVGELFCGSRWSGVHGVSSYREPLGPIMGVCFAEGVQDYFHSLVGTF